MCAALCFLAEELGLFGHQLRAGDFVITGATCILPPDQYEEGDVICATFEARARAFIEALCLVNGGHGASLRHHNDRDVAPSRHHGQALTDMPPDDDDDRGGHGDDMEII
jgi:hypothetical protein